MSDDKLTYTFTLRDGLKFHDGAPVTAEDCIASIKRWASRDAMGQKLDELHQGLGRGRRQDLHADPQRALRPGHRIAGQAQLERAVHHAQAGRRNAGQHADQGVHRLRPVRVPRRPVAAGREGGLRQVQGLQAARRAALGSVRRQGRLSRWGRMDEHPRSADRRQRPDDRRDRHPRAAADRDAAAAGEGQEHRGEGPQSAGQPVQPALQRAAQAVRQRQDPPGRPLCAEPEGLPAGGHQRPEILQGVQGALHLRHALRDRRGLRGQARIQLRQVEGDPEAGRL